MPRCDQLDFMAGLCSVGYSKQQSIGLPGNAGVRLFHYGLGEEGMYNLQQRSILNNNNNYYIVRNRLRSVRIRPSAVACLCGTGPAATVFLILLILTSSHTTTNTYPGMNLGGIYVAL